MSQGAYGNLRVEIAEKVALVTISRPQALNALNRETLEELREAFDWLREDEQVGAVILTGEGEKVFVAGADIKELAAMDDALEARHKALDGQQVFNGIESFPKPVIAAVNGFALGGGCELAMACHLRVAAQGARFGQPEVKLGLIPGYGGTQRLPRLVGKTRALELILSGETIDAAEALRIGLVNRVVAREELIPCCRDLARTLLANAPLALRYSLEAVRKGVDMPLPEALELEAMLFGFCFATEDCREGTRAFTGKRKPEFKGK